MPREHGVLRDAVRPDYDIESWRRRIPLLATLIPMNNCSQAPQTDLTRAAAERYLESWNAQRHGLGRVGRGGAAGKAGVRAADQRVARTRSRCSAPSRKRRARWRARSTSPVRRRTVVVTEAEFPTIGHVWLAQARRGARCQWVPVRDGAIDIGAYDELVDETTAVVSACHGYYLNGFTQDLRALAARAHRPARSALRRRVPDARHDAGRRARARTSTFSPPGNLKFLMGVPGIAFLYVRRELIARLEPAVTGWFGRANPFAFDVKRLDWSATASRFDTGTPPIINAYIARAGMEMINRIGRRRHSRLARGARPAADRRRPRARAHAARYDGHVTQDGDDGIHRSATRTPSSARCARAACCRRRAGR